MAEVRFDASGGLYKVTITEHDEGIQRVDPQDTKFFTTLREAQEYQRRWEEGGSRECYWRATIEKLA